MIDELPFKLSWTHYQVFARIKNVDEHHFYEIELINQQWSVMLLCAT